MMDVEWIRGVDSGSHRVNQVRGRRRHKGEIRVKRVTSDTILSFIEEKACKMNQRTVQEIYTTIIQLILTIRTNCNFLTEL